MINNWGKFVLQTGHAYSNTGRMTDRQYIHGHISVVVLLNNETNINLCCDNMTEYKEKYMVGTKEENCWRRIH